MKSSQTRYISFITLLIGLLATSMIFMPAIKFENYDTVYSGIEATFGVEIMNIGIASGQLNFSFWSFVAYGLPILAGLLAFSIKQGSFVSSLLFLISAVLLFTLPEYINSSATFLGGTQDLEINCVMQYGLLISGSLSVLGTIVSLLQGVSQLKIDN